MSLTKDQLETIAYALDSKLDKDDVVSDYIKSNPGTFEYVKNSEKSKYCTYIYLAYRTGEYLTKLTDLVEEENLHERKDTHFFLEQLMKDAREVIQLARENRKELDSYLNRIKNL